MGKRDREIIYDHKRDGEIIKRAIMMVEDKEDISSVSFLEKVFMGKDRYGLLRDIYSLVLGFADDGVIDYHLLYNHLSSCEDDDLIDKLRTFFIIEGFQLW